jgi:hypothetical protein
LVAASNIRELELPGFQFNEPFSLKPGSLAQLNHLDLAASSIQFPELLQLLAAAPRLEELELSNCRISYCHSESPTLTHLRILYLANANIDDRIIELLLKNAPFLQKLDLSRWSSGVLPIKSISSLKPNSLSHLEDLNIKARTITIKDLQTILEAAPNLKTLDLANCLFNELQPLGDFKLTSLEFLNLSQCKDFSAENLKKILLAAPNIKTIHLSDPLDPSSLDPEIQTLLSRIKEVDYYEFIWVPPLQANQTSNTFIDREDFREPPSTRPDKNRPIDHTVIPMDPIHQASDHKRFSPNKAAFEYRGQNRTKNQGMIIEKLSQYLTLTRQHVAQIPKLQDGICNALVHFFNDSSSRDWNAFIDQTLLWDGRLETLTPTLRLQFDKLFGYISSYQFGSTLYHMARIHLLGYKPQYLGDNLGPFLEGCKGPCVLSNPWHAIAIRPKTLDRWEVYDPNFVDGCREVTASDLLSTIHRSIGQLVSVESSDSRLVPLIKNSAQFIEQGGLLELAQNQRPEALLAVLDKTPEPYTKAALDGILYRDVKGIPAWVRGIKHPAIAAYTQMLLNQFIRQYPDDYAAQLQRSMECLSAQEQGAIFQHMVQYSRAQAPTMTESTVESSQGAAIPEVAENLSQALLEAIRPVPRDERDYDALFETWDSPTPHSSDLNAYCMACMSRSDIKKRLIQLKSPSDVGAMRFALQQHAKHTHRPIFYVNSPKDLVCLAPYVERQADGRGILKSGPGGPLYDFLSARKAGEAPVLIVNYSHFRADDMVRFNSLLDDVRSADSTPLPDDAIVLGLIDINQDDCYQGSDFYSRFDQVEHCPVSSDTLTLPELPFIPKPEGHTHRINLYHAPDWEQRLMGRWTLNGNALTFEEGALTKAIAIGGPIEIQNGLWNNPDFQQFWQHYCLDHPDLQLIQTDGHDWQSLTPINVHSGLVPHAPVLNPSRLGEFFKQYHTQDQQLFTSPGILQQHAEQSPGEPLVLNLTRALNTDEWAMLLEASQQFGLPQLVIHCAPGVQLPEELAGPIDAPPEENNKPNPSTRVVVSTDLDTTVAQITRKAPETWRVIDVSECNAATLLRRIDAQLIPSDPPRFDFNDPSHLLEQLLAAGEKVILKGHFSKELADELAPFLLDRLTNPRPGELWLLSPSQEPFNYFPNKGLHQVTPQDKAPFLGELAPILEPHLATEPLSQLRARAEFIVRHQGIPSEQAWAGLDHLPPTMPPMEQLDTATSEAIARDFTAKRRTAVRQVLAYAPYVFLTGLSAVGKTTFVTEELCQPGEALYIGEQKVLDWVTSDNPGPKFLFIDEANLSPKQWSEFEGLFNTPPTILVKGILYRLSKNHQVIFAGNPISYGDERQLAPFFQRHGNAVVFSPLPPALIYEKILKPIFDNTPLQSVAPAINDYLLNVYAHLCAYSTKELLISPRELQMMALLISTYHREHPDIDTLLITTHIAYQLSAHLVPDSKRGEFDSAFKPKIPLPRKASDEMRSFKLTPSREPLKHQIDDWLALREHRRAHHDPRFPQKAYGGLGGLIIEGEPGIGKSQLVMATLTAKHYEKNRDFYLIPVGMPLNEKKDLLKRAFNQGAIVIIDEINSSPMMERLLNTLLMGKDEDGQRPEHPGFMVIGTQNPVTMAGRRAPSTALARRMTTVELPPYPLEEIRSILINKGLSAPQSLAMAESFIKQWNHAQEHHLSPAPTFRDLMRRADEVLRTAQALAPQTLEQKQAACRALLEHIQTTQFAPDDVEMTSFIEHHDQEIREATPETINALLLKLTTLQERLCNLDTQLQDIKIIISQCERQATTFFGIGMTAKANRIKTAIKQVPVEERVNLFKARSDTARVALNALAAHALLFGYVFKDEDDDIDREWAAESYQLLRRS